MDKLTISKEEEKLIGEYREVVPEAHRWIEQFRKYQKAPFNAAQFTPLLDFTPQQFALLLCGWYEVEEPLKVGDWAVHKKRGYIGRVITEHAMNRVKSDARPSLQTPIEHFRHATPDEIAQEVERRKWAAVDRKVNEYKEGDIFKNGDMLHVVTGLGDPRLVYEGFEPFSKSEITMVVPVEQRFDKEGF